MSSISSAPPLGIDEVRAAAAKANAQVTAVRLAADEAATPASKNLASERAQLRSAEQAQAAAAAKVKADEARPGLTLVVA